MGHHSLHHRLTLGSHSAPTKVQQAAQEAFDVLLRLVNDSRDEADELASMVIAHGTERNAAIDILAAVTVSNLTDALEQVRCCLLVQVLMLRASTHSSRAISS